MEKKNLKKYPVKAEHYELYEEIGQGASASVYRAMCIPTKEIVAIKVLDFECANSDVDKISREAQTLTLVDHPNVLNAHCSFVYDHNLWVVMPFMPGGSCLHILRAAHPEGFEEVVIATILRETLKALVYLHGHGIIHRDVKAGNILICDRGSIKLGDLGVSACLFDSGDRQHLRKTFVGTPCWMAPEVMEHTNGYDFKADIWSFGITALELAHGHAPFSKYPPIKVLLMTLQNAPPGLDYESDKKFSKSFKQMIASCLVKNPKERPSAAKLLKHSFFKQAKSDEFIVRKLLKGMPTLGDRLQAIKKEEEDMLTQKKIPDDQKEEMSQNKYKRGISCWDFDLDDVKAQSALIHDEELIADKDQLRSSSSSDETVVNESEHPNQLLKDVLKAARSSIEPVVGESEVPNQFSNMKEVSKPAGASYETVVGVSELPEQLSYMKKVSEAPCSSIETIVCETELQNPYETVIGYSELPYKLSHMKKVSKAPWSSVETVVCETELPNPYETVIGFSELPDQLSHMEKVSKPKKVSKPVYEAVRTVIGESELQDQLSYMKEVSKPKNVPKPKKVSKPVYSVETLIDDNELQNQLSNALKGAASSVETVIG